MNAPLSRVFARPHDGNAEAMSPGRLWSLWDMLKENAASFMELGARVHDVTAVYEWDKYHPIDETNSVRRLNAEGERAIREHLRSLIVLADRLKLPVSKAVLERHLDYADSTPQSQGEYERVVSIFRDELSSLLFLFVPSHLAKYYECDDIVSDAVATAFPKASEELRQAGTCFSTASHTACVFHAMRAAEIGLRALGTKYEITLKGGKAIEMAQWGEILDGLSKAAIHIENRPNNDPTKDSDLLFLSEACAQFRFFKSGWRIRVAHARATYNEAQALEALEHVRSFFETLASQLKETAP
jgi:hypothetical protein